MKPFSLDDAAKARATDMAKVRATTDEEIARQIAEDPDTAPSLGGVDVEHFTVRRPYPDVRFLRKQLGLTQEEFARDFGVNVWTLRDWENHRREPEGPAQTLLKVIAQSPDTVRRAVATDTGV
ncbi:helix-turn-helix domain-containing protein [Azospirillum rugosum]|uniref:Transcriptional regulator n=1 Tax=Azospirillum rugosum TaxID=416170 RepID=A0ABS4SRS3_9PROT|nr:helix-turn-helix domain-containing protein [Azospirillum rugosum]MBP2294919.1 putative transcriptional regulator [Azospirillum rugosum]MDQ0528159.1 putative transcriptional regulator [Azospirillum rugosum]